MCNWRSHNRTLWLPCMLTFLDPVWYWKKKRSRWNSPSHAPFKQHLWHRTSQSVPQYRTCVGAGDGCPGKARRNMRTSVPELRHDASLAGRLRKARGDLVMWASPCRLPRWNWAWWIYRKSWERNGEDGRENSNDACRYLVESKAEQSEKRRGQFTYRPQ